MGKLSSANLAPNTTVFPYAAVATTSAPTTTSGVFVVIPEMTITFTPMGTKQLVLFSIDTNTQNADTWTLQLFLDGVAIANTDRLIQEVDPGGLLGTPGAIPGAAHSCQALLSGLTSASHTIDARWKVSSGAARTVLLQRSLIVVDIL